VVATSVVYSPTRPCSDQAGRPDFCGPGPFPGTVARLFRNQGRIPGSIAKAVRFEDVTVRSGLGRLAGPGLGVVCADFNGDRWPDIFIANDGKANHLWINQRDGTFKEEALLRGLAYNGLGQAQANMGIALGDVDGDGLFDLFVPHLAEELHVLWRQGPSGQFHDRTAAAGLANPGWRSTGFGTVFGDFDLDGALDLALANGSVKHSAMARRPARDSFWEQFDERNQLFAGDGTGRFRDLSPENKPFCGTGAVSRGLACGDIRNSGALDLLVTAVAGPARLFRNVAPRRGHWLTVRAVDPKLGGRDAYGAEITVRAGDRHWLRLLNPGYSYLCSNDPRAHFGLGQAERFDAIDVVWPDGSDEQFAGSATDQTIVLRKGDGQRSSGKAKISNGKPPIANGREAAP
jgi:enediyne biosynthesis protein E4